MDIETKFHIFGCGTEDILFHETYTESEARQWVASYTRDGFGGHDYLRIDAYGNEENYPVEYFYNESEV